MPAVSIYKSPEGEKQVMALYDAALSHWPVPYEALRLPTRHGETFVIASGDPPAPPLVLLHGAASNAVSWVGDVAAYCPHFRVYAVDIPGDPGKSVQNRLPWDGPGYAEWLEDVLDGLDARCASLLGLSQGGWTALKFATYRPERVDKLVLLTPGGIVPTRTSFILSAVVLSMFGRWGAERLNRKVFGRQPIHPEAARFMDTIMTHHISRIDKEYIFSDAELARLTMPVLLLGGAEDAIRPMDAAIARMEKLVSNLQAALIPDMGHVLVGMPERILPFLLAQTS
jgi:pimeloyl-ACP methyl ester carboxylesterase